MGTQRILFVGTNSLGYEALKPALVEHGFAGRWLETPADALKQLSDGEPAIVVTHLGVDGAAQFLETLSKRHDVCEVVLVATQSAGKVLDATDDHDVDLLSCPEDPLAVVTRLRRAVRHRKARLEAVRLRQAIAEASGFEEIIGVSPPMQEMFELLDRAATTNASVLVTGESGTGKELVARALHRHGKRRERPFVAVNCSAVPEALLESELFGHVKGAFTDAKAARSGLFSKAHGGTLFLDEIGDMPVALQPKLLRALQERLVRPVGGDYETPIDVRVVAATNHNLEEAVAAKSFREDLFYRLNVIHIEVPPLRERSSDILLIAQHFVEHFALTLEKEVRGISRDAGDKLLAYGWPGNVRELQNSIERATALTRDDEIQESDLPRKLREYKPSHILIVSNEPAELVPLEEVERRYILRVLEAVSGNKKEAARILKLDRKTLYRKLARYGVVSKDSVGSR